MSSPHARRDRGYADGTLALVAQGRGGRVYTDPYRTMIRAENIRPDERVADKRIFP